MCTKSKIEGGKKFHPNRKTPRAAGPLEDSKTRQPTFSKFRKTNSIFAPDFSNISQPPNGSIFSHIIQSAIMKRPYVSHDVFAELRCKEAVWHTLSGRKILVFQFYFVSCAKNSKSKGVKSVTRSEKAASGWTLGGSKTH